MMGKVEAHPFTLEEVIIPRPAKGNGGPSAGASKKLKTTGASAASRILPYEKFPRWWAHRMKNSSAGAFQLALLLLLLDWKSQGRPVVVSSAAAKEYGMGRWQKRSAVLELERLGVIRVKRRERKSSLITALKSPVASSKQV